MGNVQSATNAVKGEASGAAACRPAVPVPVPQAVSLVVMASMRHHGSKSDVIPALSGNGEALHEG
jgi:hypothetical protein